MTGSQKALSLPTGLGIVCVSKKARNTRSLPSDLPVNRPPDLSTADARVPARFPHTGARGDQDGEAPARLLQL